MDDEKPTPQAIADAWVEGHKAGYAKGRDDGIGIGYADAKARAWNAVEAAADEGGGRTVVRVEILRRTLATNVGQTG